MALLPRTTNVLNGMSKTVDLNDIFLRIIEPSKNGLFYALRILNLKFPLHMTLPKKSSMTLEATIGPANCSTLCHRLRFALGVFALMLGLGVVPSAMATPTTLTFDEFADGTAVSTQYQGVGVTVVGAVTINYFNLPWPPFSAPNVVYAPNGPMTFTFDSNITGTIQTVWAYISDSTMVPSLSTGLYAFDAANALLGLALTPTGTNVNYLLSVTSSGNPIARVELLGWTGNYSIDDLTFVSSVPEPATAWLIGFGLFGLLSVSRWKKII